MNRSRMAVVALTAAAVAARGVLAARPMVGRPRPTAAGPEPATRSPQSPDPIVPPSERPRVPWLVSHADQFFTVMAMVSLVGSLLLVGWRWSGRSAGGDEGTTLGAVLGTVVLWSIYLMWKVPQWQAAGKAASGELDKREQFEIENAARSTLGQILSGVAVLTGLLFAWQQLGNTNDNLQLSNDNLLISREGQITDRFARAVEQLGSDDPTIRIGAIYALERIARDSERDHRPVMEVLTAFVRNEPEGAATPVTGSDVQGTVRGTEVRAALGVIGRRDAERDGGGECLNLYGARLIGIDLAGFRLARTCFRSADLPGATFAAADLTGGSFQDADLSGANLGEAVAVGVNFRDATLTRANLIGADLTGASLTGADLSGALLDEATILSGADLNGADLRGAILFGVDLSETRFVSSEQLAVALIDGRTALPPGLATPPSR